MLESFLGICDFFQLMSDTCKIDIDHIARLARIELTPSEKEKFSDQLEKILEYIEKLSGVDIEGVEPSAHAHAIYNVWRGDEADEGMPISDALMNAPKSRENQVVVPKVVDDA